MKLSVVTPSYNQAAFLEETLRSVISQREFVHEYLVLDGGSDDGSVDIIRRYQQHLDFWVSEPDKGQCDAIHRGFSRCTGDVLYWINSDDVLLPGALEKVHAAYDVDPSLDVVSGWGVAIDGGGRIIKMKRPVHDSPWWGCLGYLRVNQPCTFFRRALYEEVGGLDLDLHCVLDTELWYRMFRAGSTWGGIDDYVAAYRLHDGAKGSVLQQRYKQERAILKEKYPDLVDRKMAHTLGRLAYYTAQLASGRTFSSMADMRRHHGRPIVEVFGEWEISEPASAGA